MKRYRLCFSKGGLLKYISHLDLQRTFGRALRRGAVPIVYSQGFSPQPRLLFASPLALGIEGKNEYLDLYLNMPWQENKLKETMNSQLPPGLSIKDVYTVDSGQPSLSSLIRAALYNICFPVVPDNLPQALGDLLQAETIPVKRRGKKGSKLIDMRPFLFQLKLKRQGEKGMLQMLLAAGSQGGARPQEVLALLPLSGARMEIIRDALFIAGGEGLITPTGEAAESYLEVSYGKKDCDKL